MNRKKETLPRIEFVNLASELECGDELISELNSWDGGKTCKLVEYTVDSLGRIDSGSSPSPTPTTIEIKADDENNSDVFWAAFDEAYPVVADHVREGIATVDEETWRAIQRLEGFGDGPDYAPHALIEA